MTLPYWKARTGLGSASSTAEYIMYVLWPLKSLQVQGEIFWDNEISCKLQQKKYNLGFTVDADRKQNCLNYNNDN